MASRKKKLRNRIIPEKLFYDTIVALNSRSCVPLELPSYILVSCRSIALEMPQQHTPRSYGVHTPLHQSEDADRRSYDIVGVDTRGTASPHSQTRISQSGPWGMLATSLFAHGTSVAVPHIILAPCDWLKLPNPLHFKRLLLLLYTHLTRRACAAATTRVVMHLRVSMALFAHLACMHRLLAVVALESCITRPFILRVGGTIRCGRVALCCIPPKTSQKLALELNPKVHRTQQRTKGSI